MQSSFVQTSDLRMHYLQQGTGDAVIFIHGFPEISYEWRHQFAALSDRYACFAPDTRGYGLTDKPGVRASRQLIAGDIIRFMDALGIEQAAVVGHDWGGFVAFKVAVDWPERVTRLALLDTFCTTWGPSAVHGFWFKAEGLAEAFFAEYHDEFIDSIFGRSPRRPLPGRPASPWRFAPAEGVHWATDEDLKVYKTAFSDPMVHANAISYYRYALPLHVVVDDANAGRGESYHSLSEPGVAAMWLDPAGLEEHPLFRATLDFGPEDRHKQYQGPALWLYGAGFAAMAANAAPDGVLRGRPAVDQFSRYLPDLRGRLMPGGHFFPEEAPEATNEVLAQFLSGQLDRHG